MKGVCYAEHGGPEVLRVSDTLQKPVLSSPLHVLIEVKAASLNPVDCKLRNGLLPPPFVTLPFVAGSDCAGVVVQVGADVKSVNVGDEVYAMVDTRRGGCHAEYVLVSEHEVALKPKNLSWVEAASLPLVVLTVWQSLVVNSQVKEGDRVLVLGGSGGVGTIAVQLAKYLKCYVCATCSSRNTELMKQLGCDEVIDYTQVKFEEKLKDFNVVLDAVGGNYCQGFAVLANGGTYVDILADNFDGWANKMKWASRAAWFKVSLYLFHGKSYKVTMVKSDHTMLTQIAQIVEAGGIRPVIDSTFPLSDIIEAHKKSETGRARGKIVITLP